CCECCPRYIRQMASVAAETRFHAETGFLVPALSDLFHNYRPRLRVACFRGCSREQQALQFHRENMLNLQKLHAFAVGVISIIALQGSAKACHPDTDRFKS